MKSNNFKCKVCGFIFESSEKHPACQECQAQETFKYFGDYSPMIQSEDKNPNIEARLQSQKKHLKDEIQDLVDKKRFYEDLL